MPIRTSTLLMLVAASAPAFAANTIVSIGGDLSVFDNPRAQQGSMPLDVSYVTSRWIFEATDTYFYREGTPTIVFKNKKKNGPQIILVPEHVGNRVIWVPRPRKPIAGEPTEYGWGDLSLNTVFSAIVPNEHNIGVDFTASATLPTGSESKGFSTGTEEYSLGTILTKFVGPMTFSLNALHSWNGTIKNAPTQNNWAGQFSSIYTSPAGNTIGLQFNGAQPSAPNTGSSRILSFVSSIVLSKQDKVAFTLGHGFGLNDPTTDINVTMSRTF